MTTSFFRACAFLAAVLCASRVGAQGPIADASAEPRAATTEDAQGAAEAGSGRLAQTFSWAESKIDGASGTRDGWYPEFGGMITGAGLSIGPGYRHHLFGNRGIVDVSAAVSWRQYMTMRSQFTWIFSDRFSVGAEATHQDFTQINFFGIGRDSLKSNHTDYRLKDLDAHGVATLRANRWLSINGRAGILRNLAIAAGTSTLYPSIGDQFDEGSAPSLTRQPGYLHADVAVDADTRDVPGYPSSGGRYRLSVAAFHDRDFSRYSFTRVEADGAQYIPLGATVLAVRGRLDLSQTGVGQDVPFYLLPSLGGPKSLGGYLDYRFRDRDLVLLNAEYRWPIVRAVDAAMFYEAGTVAPAASELWRRLHTDYGAGLRLHTATHMVVRLDVARSREGTRALLTFTAPLSLPSRTVAPYVP